MAEDKQLKVITPKEIKQIAPLSEVYQLSKYDKYLVIIEASSLEGRYELSHQRARQIAAAMKQLELTPVIMIVDAGTMQNVKFYEFKEEKH